ncbi:MAG: acetate--CoA ligase [Ignavibacteriae bacterium]|nr:acetate--CoA ligase [Ignavibacteriota bacterium]
MESISSLLQEHRIFNPSKKFSQNANIGSMESYASMRQIANLDPLTHWNEQANKIHWFSKWETILDWKYPHAQWFKEGYTNAAFNCLDIHKNTPTMQKTALLWEREDGLRQSLTYEELHSKVCLLANALKSIGIVKGNVITIYMGMNPEAIIAMLACARIGAVHNVVFGGFSSDALRDRINDSSSVCIITQNATLRRGASIPLLTSVEQAVKECPTVQSIICKDAINIVSPLIHDWDTILLNQNDICEAEHLESEHPLFFLYTSGSTGKPKGLVHTTGGYLTHVRYSFEMVFDPKPNDIYFCSADIGWITGHSYVVYGPLMHGMTILIYEGALNHPHPGRIWELIASYGATILYTAPTAIRSFMGVGNHIPEQYALDSLRLLGTVGEPINPEAWMWYHEVIGKSRCPIVDTWWQTETGGIMIAPVPGAVPTKPGTATLPLPGILADVIKKNGESCLENEGGYLTITYPWPGMARTIFGDDERYKCVYWSEFPPNDLHQGMYFTGDGARKDEDGYFWIMGRVDDVVNVSGHRLGTAEIESALVSHPAIAEAAVVARPDEIKGNVLIAFVTVIQQKDIDLSSLENELKQHVAKEIGALAKPEEIRFTSSLPKTRSGKIMRRLLRELVSHGTISGDTTTLEDFSALEQLRTDEE